MRDFFNKGWDIIMDIYREMYSRATPKADFDELIRTGEAKKSLFFQNYYLDGETQEEIIMKHCKKFGLSGLQIDRIKTQVHLGCSPTEIKKKVD